MSIKNDIMALVKESLKGLDESDKAGDLKTLQGIKLFLTGSLAAQASSGAVESGGDFAEEGATEESGDFGSEESGGDFGEESGGDFGSEESGDFSEETPAEETSGDFGEEESGGDFGEEESGGDFAEEGTDDSGPDFGEEEPKASKTKEDPNTYGGKTAKELVDILKANGVPGPKLKEIWNKGQGPAIIKFAKEIDALAKTWIDKFGTAPIEKIEAFAKKKGIEVKYGPGRKNQEKVAAKTADALAARGIKP